MFTIHRATLDDVDELVQLRLKLFRETGDLISDEPLPELIEATRMYLLKNIPTERFLAWIAVAEGRIVGMSGLVFLEKPPTDRNRYGVEAYIMNMYTVPEWRSKGVATSILNELIHFVKTTKARRIWLNTTQDGRHMYERAGFIFTSQDMELVW
jgi:GNAT superfamily N-acetyltransferase